MPYFQQAADSARQGNPEFRLEIFSGQAGASSGFTTTKLSLRPHLPNAGESDIQV